MFSLSDKIFGKEKLKLYFERKKYMESPLIYKIIYDKYNRESLFNLVRSNKIVGIETATIPAGAPPPPPNPVLIAGGADIYPLPPPPPPPITVKCRNEACSGMFQAWKLPDMLLEALA
jgi:hypothetical protein